MQYAYLKIIPLCALGLFFSSSHSYAAGNLVEAALLMAAAIFAAIMATAADVYDRGSSK